MTMTSGTETSHILFVCRGNLCRSPMAMALLRYRLGNTKGAADVAVDSAGYCDFGLFSREAHPFARRAVSELCGQDLLANHVARQWTQEMVDLASAVVVAESWMCSDFPAGKVMTMRELAGETGDVADPYGGAYETYVRCARDLDRLITAGWPRRVESAGGR